MFGDCCIPCLLLMLGATLSKGPGQACPPLRVVASVAAARLVLLPLIGTGWLVLAKKLGEVARGGWGQTCKLQGVWGACRLARGLMCSHNHHGAASCAGSARHSLSVCEALCAECHFGWCMCQCWPVHSRSCSCSALRVCCAAFHRPVRCS